MDKRVEEQIIKLISTEPRSINEVSKVIGKCWKTTDKYICKLAEHNNSVIVKVFRKGSQGALKVVFLRSSVQTSADIVQEKFFKTYLSGNAKDDFDVLDLYMRVPKEMRSSIVEKYTDPCISTEQDLINKLENCKRTLFCFSGNLSWINMVENGRKIIDVLADLIGRGVKVKVLCRIDPASIKNIGKLKSIDNKLGGNKIEIRHIRQPLRGFLFDDNFVRLKEEAKVWKYRKGEIDSDMRTFYDISDPTWVSWFKNVFYYSFNSSMSLENYSDYFEKMVNFV